MTNEELRQIEKRHSKITPGGWFVRGDEWTGLFIQNDQCTGNASGQEILADDDYNTKAADIDFVVNAPTDISALLAHCRELEAEVKRLKLYESVVMTAEVDKVINDTRAHFRGEATND